MPQKEPAITFHYSDTVASPKLLENGKTDNPLAEPLCACYLYSNLVSIPPCDTQHFYSTNGGGENPLTTDTPCCCVDLSVWDSCENTHLCGFDITFDADNFDPLCNVCRLPPGWIFTQNPDGSLSLTYSGADCNGSVGEVPQHFQFCGHNSSGTVGYTVCGYYCTQDPTTGNCIQGGRFCCKHFTSVINCGPPSRVEAAGEAKPLTVDAGYPNPATSSTRFDYTAPYESTMSLTLVDVLGRVIGTSSKIVSKGNGNVTIGLAGAQPGDYYCVFELSGQRVSRRIQIK